MSKKLTVPSPLMSASSWKSLVERIEIKGEMSSKFTTTSRLTSPNSNSGSSETRRRMMPSRLIRIKTSPPVSKLKRRSAREDVAFENSRAENQKSESGSAGAAPRPRLRRIVCCIASRVRSISMPAYFHLPSSAVIFTTVGKATLPPGAS